MRLSRKTPPGRTTVGVVRRVHPSAASRWERRNQNGSGRSGEYETVIRRRPGRTRCWKLRRDPQVREDLPNDRGLLDRRDQFHAATALRTGEYVDLEGPAHE